MRFTEKIDFLKEVQNFRGAAGISYLRLWTRTEQPMLTVVLFVKCTVCICMYMKFLSILLKIISRKKMYNEKKHCQREDQSNTVTFIENITPRHNKDRLPGHYRAVTTCQTCRIFDSTAGEWWPRSFCSSLQQCSWASSSDWKRCLSLDQM